MTCAIFTTAARNIHGKGPDVKHPVETAKHLGAIFGGHQLFSLGFFAAGITSSITAPLAAAYATCGCLGRSTEMREPSMKWVVPAVILVGTIAGLIGSSPKALIIFAQTANGLLLPIVTWFLLVSMNHASILGSRRNGLSENTVAGLVIVSVTALAMLKIWQLAT